MQLFANNIETTLSASLSSSATSASVTSATGMPVPTGGDYFLLTLCKRSNNVERSFEIVKVTAVSGTTLTIVRGQEGTSGTAYVSGDIVSLRLTAGTLGDERDAVALNTAKRSYPSGDETKLAGIETSADVTDATNVNAAGATMNADTNVSNNGWVLDEDDMASDSATKVPTQQSVKAYTDVKTFSTVAKTANYTLTAADCNGFKTFTNEGASGDVSFTLPAGASGLRVKFLVAAPKIVKIYANGAETMAAYTLRAADGWDDGDMIAVSGGSYHNSTTSSTRTFGLYLSNDIYGGFWYLTSVSLVWAGGVWQVEAVKNMSLGYTNVSD